MFSVTLLHESTIILFVFILKFYIKLKSFLLPNLCTQRGNRFSILKWKMKNKFLLLARFFLQMQKASSKTRFGLNKFYFNITNSLQSLTLLSFIFRFSKWNWKTKIDIISFYGDLKSTDLLLNYWWIWAACWQYIKKHLSWDDQ